jgi:uncharacterized repeat protein (TIGR04076 family)
MFKVKATVAAFLGDTEKYPCHFDYKIGDEIIWNGAELKGRICPGVMQPLIAKMGAMYSAGPRYVEPIHYVPFWYAPPSTCDPSMKKYDGIGFRNTLQTIEDLPYGMSLLRDPNSFKWPPHPERTVSRGTEVICGDTRTSVVLTLEVIDLADDGDCVTYYRREMSILNRVLPKPGISIDKIIDEFTKEEIEEIYPALSKILVQILVEELELVGYLEIKDGKATVTEKGKAKLESFKKTLSAEEKEALKM